MSYDSPVQDQVLCVSSYQQHSALSGDQAGVVVIWNLKDGSTSCLQTFGARSSAAQVISSLGSEILVGLLHLSAVPKLV